MTDKHKATQRAARVEDSAALGDRTPAWIELVLGMSCNCRCRACPSSHHDGGEPMSSREIAAWLERGRRLGATGAWFGGGEPTLHPSLPSAVARARKLGYQRVRLQTNALRLAYADYAHKLVRAGVSEISVPVLGANGHSYDAFTRREGSYELLVQGIRNVAALGASVEGDVLITAQSMDRMAEAVERFADLGLSRFTFWLVSMHGLDAQRHAHRLPAMEALAPHLQRAMERAESLGAGAATLHTPPCVLARRHRPRYVHAGTWRLLVKTPGAAPFWAEQSPMEGGHYLPGCGACAWRGRCLGLRADYLEIHGGEQFVPLEQTRADKEEES